MTEIIIAKPGEITLKSRKVRKRFEDRLISNIKDIFHRVGISTYKIKKFRGRFVIETDSTEEGLRILRNVFGLNQIETALMFRFKDFDEILQKGEEIFKDRVRGKKFAVRVRRTGSHSFKSIDVERALGGRLFPYSAGVDLTRPEVRIEVEIVDDIVFYILEKISGAGGLPVGIEGKILLLFSGGFDSTVSYYLLLKRGLEVDLVSFLFAGEPQLRSIFRIAKFLSDRYAAGYDPALYTIDFASVTTDIRKNVKESYRNIVLKRQMIRAAEILAREKDILAIATGDSIGQVASQTFDNLIVSSHATKLPIIRPVVTFDKQEIIDIARKIGVYDLVSSMKEYCQITPRHPVTRASVEAVQKQEVGVNLQILQDLVSKRRTFYPTKIDDIEILDTQMELHEIPEDAIIFDIRDRIDFEKHHLNGAINIDEFELLSKIDELDRSRIYVVACYRGARSLNVVNEMRKYGLKAYSLKGGMEAYK